MSEPPPEQEPTARALLHAAADTLRYYADHGGYITDNNSETHSLWADERTALALARKITLLDTDAGA